jgi:hypothetical protein
MNTVRQFFNLSIPTPGAILGSESGIYSYQPPTSIFSFVSEILSKLRPCRIGNGFSKTAIMQHPVDRQVFNTDCVVFIDDFSGFLMTKVIAPIGYSLVHFSNSLASFLSFWTSLFRFRQLLLNFNKVFFIFSKEAGIVNFIPIGESRKRDKTYINANSLIRFGEWFVFSNTGKTYIPFAHSRFSNCAGFDLPVWLPVKKNLNSSYFRKFKSLLCNLEACLRKGNAIVTAIAFESWIARLFSSLNSAKEGFKGKVNSDCHILQHLRINIRKRLFALLELNNRNSLGIIVKTFLFLFPGVLTLCKKMIVEPTAFLKPMVHRCFLLSGWIYSVLEIKHVYIMPLKLSIVKQIFHERNTAFIRQLKQVVFCCLSIIKPTSSIL